MRAILHLIAAWFAVIARTPWSQTTLPNPAVSSVAERVIAGATAVLNALGSGLPEVIYENALAHELRKSGLTVNQQQNVGVYYDQVIVGDYAFDLVVENTVLVEMEATRRNHSGTAECRKYLKPSGFTLCLLLNFGKTRLATKRIIIRP
jgi:GxxExxY protein